MKKTTLIFFLVSVLIIASGCKNSAAPGGSLPLPEEPASSADLTKKTPEFDAARNSFLVRTPGELLYLGENPQVLQENAKNIILLKNLDFCGENLTPLELEGSFDGGSKVIRNVVINTTRNLSGKTDSEKQYTGLIRTVKQNKQLRNLIMQNADVTGYQYVGAFAGLNSGTIENCGTAGGRVRAYVNDCGGIAGRNLILETPTTPEKKAIIQNCFNSANITAGQIAGGITGWNYTNGNILQSYNTGTVLVEKWTPEAPPSPPNSTGYGSGAGGIAGHGGFKIENCYNTGEITGTNSIGGILGSQLTNNTVSYCYNVGQTKKNLTSLGGGTIGDSQTNSNNISFFLENTGYASYRGVSKSAEAFGKESTFTNWDFDSVWTIKTINGFTRPVLQKTDEEAIAKQFPPIL